MAEAESGRWRVVDAERSAEEVTAAIFAELAEWLP